MTCDEMDLIDLELKIRNVNKKRAGPFLILPLHKQRKSMVTLYTLSTFLLSQ